MPSARRAQPEADPSRLRGIFLLALAVLTLVEPFLLAKLMGIPAPRAGAIGSAAFMAALGAAVLQGSNAARLVTLVLSGLALLGFTLLGGLAMLIGAGHLWPIFAAGAAMMAGIVAVMFDDECPSQRAFGGMGLAGVGWVASIVAEVLLVGTLDLGTIRAMREWTLPERTVGDAASGVELRLPPTWVLLKPENELYPQGGAMATIASTEIHGHAQLFRETRTISAADSVDTMLQAAADALHAGGSDYAARAASDSSVSGVAARRMEVTWTDPRDVHRTALLVGWRDADVFYRLVLLGPTVVAKRLDEDLQGLIGGLTFTPRRQLFLNTRGHEVRAACPLLSEPATLDLLRVVGEGGTPEAFCREGYRLAFAGLSGLEPATSRRLAQLMAQFNDAVPRAQIARYGAWVEKLRAGASTTAEEDRAMTEIARTAMVALPAPTQDELRNHLAMAIDMGGFGQALR